MNKPLDSPLSRDTIPLVRTKTGTRKLSDDDVRAIRKMAKDGYPASAIQKFFPSVATETIRKVARRDTFVGVSDFVGEGKEVPEDHIAAQIRMIREAEEKRRLSAKSLLEEIGKDQPAA